MENARKRRRPRKGGKSFADKAKDFVENPTTKEVSKEVGKQLLNNAGAIASLIPGGAPFAGIAQAIGQSLAQLPALKTELEKANHPEWYGGDSNSVTGFASYKFMDTTTDNIGQLTVEHYSLDTANFTEFGLATNDVTRLITALSTRMGLAVSTTASEVENYLRVSSELLANLFVLQRVQNAAQLIASNGMTMNQVLHSYDSTSTIGEVFTQAQPAYAAPLGITRTVSTQSYNISNYVWETACVSPTLRLAYVSDNMFAFLKHHFSYWFNDMSEVATVIFDFVPYSGITTATYFKDKVDALIVDLQGKLASDPIIPDILESLGIKAAADQSHEWSRDKAAMSITVVKDEMMSVALANRLQWPQAGASGFYPSSGDEGDLRTTLFIPSNSNPLSPEKADMSTLTIGQFFALAKFRGIPSTRTQSAARARGYTVMTDKNTVEHYKWIPANSQMNSTDITAANIAGFYGSVVDMEQAAARVGTVCDYVYGVLPVIATWGITSTWYYPNQSTYSYMSLPYDGYIFSDFDWNYKLAVTNLTLGVNYRSQLAGMVQRISGSSDKVK